MDLDIRCPTHSTDLFSQNDSQTSLMISSVYFYVYDSTVKNKCN
ncbi:hypothetical protein IGK47_002870 [Enterococcus sp. AZ007]